jgi:hypothetical protein
LGKVKKKDKGDTPKKVVYLFGTGASQAEINLFDDTIRILMRDIKDGMLSKIIKKKIRVLNEVKNELAAEHADVEQLISLYESTGIYKHTIIAMELKKLFWEEIEERINKLGNGHIPILLSALVDMHEIPELGEELTGILTLNYEDLIEKAIQEVKGKVDYSIKVNENHSYLDVGSLSYPLLKLHGSFNWRNEFPITLSKIKKSEDVLWIPPGVEKRRKRYPFSILWDRARESISRNDWHLVSLLYTTQKLKTTKKPYDIELINYFDTGKEIENNYPYLSFRNVSQIPEVRDYMTSSYSLKHKEEDKLSKAIEELLSSRNLNVFDIWLKAKGEVLKNQDISISTQKSIFENYIKAA